MSKSEIVQKIAEQLPNNLTRDEIKGVLDALADVGYAELKQTGAFLVPGFAKFEVTLKLATEEREGINPFTKEPMTFKAKPASKVVGARPIKALKDALQELWVAPPTAGNMRADGGALVRGVLLELPPRGRPRCKALVGCHSMRAGTDQGLFRRGLVFLKRFVPKA